MSKLDDLMARVRDELQVREEARLSIEEKAQKARTKSKQAIQLVHRGDIEKAGQRIVESAGFLHELCELLEHYPEFSHYGSVAAAWQEHAEAVIFTAVIRGEGYPEPAQTPLDHYVLGLGDVVGELRRAAVDDLRLGRMDLAEARLGLMEEIYEALIAGEDVTILLKDMRRKIDAARGIIEATRGDIALEAGRKRLDDSIRELSRKMDQKQ